MKKLSNYHSDANLCMENKNDDIENLNKTLKFDRKRYVTKLPFIENPENLPDNYILAIKRAENLVSTLRKNSEQLLEYDNIINYYFKDGILEEVFIN